MGFDGDMFYNCCIGVETVLKPHDLLNILLIIEKEAGRIRKKNVGYSSRIIDLDILFYQDQLINTSDLIVPHPKLHQREFVIKPLLDIANSKIHPKFQQSI